MYHLLVVWYYSYDSEYGVETKKRSIYDYMCLCENLIFLMKKRNPFISRTPLLIYTEYKPFLSIFDFLLCPFECSYHSRSASMRLLSGESGIFSIAEISRTPLSFNAFLWIEVYPKLLIARPRHEEDI